MMKQEYAVHVIYNGVSGVCYEEAESMEQAIQQCLRSRRDWDWDNFKVVKCLPRSK